MAVGVGVEDLHVPNEIQDYWAVNNYERKYKWAITKTAGVSSRMLQFFSDLFQMKHTYKYLKGKSPLSLSL